MLSMNLGSRPSSKVTSPIFQHPSLQTISNSKQPTPSRNDIYKPCHCQSVPSMCVCEPPESCHEQSSLSRASAMKIPTAWHCKTLPSICVCEPRESCHEQNSLSRAFKMTQSSKARNDSLLLLRMRADGIMSFQITHPMPQH